VYTHMAYFILEGGLGAIQTDTTGFGVGFGLEMLQSLLAS